MPAKAILPWRDISFTRTTGTCARPGGCSRSARPPGKTWARRTACCARSSLPTRTSAVACAALWALHATGGLDEEALSALLDHASEHVRAWGIRLLCDDGKAPTAGDAEPVRRARQDRSEPEGQAEPGLGLAALPAGQRWAVAEPLASHQEDASDRSLPLMIWYGVEPLVPADRARAVSLAARCKIRPCAGYVARRAVAADPAAGLAAVVSLLKAPTTRLACDLLIGARDALRGRKHVARPEGWPEAFADLVARRDLNVIEANPPARARLEEPKAVAVLRRIALDRARRPRNAAERSAAWWNGACPGLPRTFKRWSRRALRGLVLRSLAAYDDPATPEIILQPLRRISRPSVTMRSRRWPPARRGRWRCSRPSGAGRFPGAT